MQTTTAPTTVFILGNVLPQNGGVTNAVYARANALAEISQRVIIATLQFDINFREHVKRLKTDGKLLPTVEVVNQYERNSFDANQEILAPHNPEWTYFQDNSREHAYRVFDHEGRYIRYECRRSNGTLDFVDHFTTPWKRTRKSNFDSQGMIRRELYMSNNDGAKAEFRVIKNNAGNPVASSKLSDSGRPVSFFSHAEQTEYGTEIEMAVPWLSRMTQDSERVILFIEKREFVKPLSALPMPKYAKIFVMHNNHLDYPFDDVNTISPSTGDAFEGINQGTIERMVFLTSKQADDAKRILDDPARISVVNNFLHPLEIPLVPRERHLVVSIARYHYQKNLSEALEVFKAVLDEVPDAKYEIYGYGPELTMLAARARELNIADSVQLSKHTSEPLSMLARASASLLTSRYEGMPLTLLESQAVGTPPVAYDIRYGPSEIIRNGVDGYLIEYSENRVKSAADAIVTLMTNDAQFERMSASGKTVFERFSAKRAADEWKSLIAELGR